MGISIDGNALLPLNHYADLTIRAVLAINWLVSIAGLVLATMALLKRRLQYPMAIGRVAKYAISFHGAIVLAITGLFAFGFLFSRIPMTLTESVMVFHILGLLVAMPGIIGCMLWWVVLISSRRDDVPPTTPAEEMK